MAEGQKQKHIGRGMKPPRNQRVKAQKEAKKVTEQSTTEGQQIGIKEPVLEPQAGNETPGNLEPEKGEESLQNLEKSEATGAPVVALDAGLEAAMYRASQSWSHCPLIPGYPHQSIPNFGVRGFSVRL